MLPVSPSRAPSSTTPHPVSNLSHWFPTRRNREEDDEGGASKRVKLEGEERNPSPSSSSRLFDGRDPEERPNDFLERSPNRFHLPSSLPSNGNLDIEHHQAAYTLPSNRRSLSPLRTLSPFSSSEEEGTPDVVDLIEAQLSLLRSQAEQREQQLSSDLEKERALRVQTEKILEEERKEWKQKESSLRARVEQLEEETRVGKGAFKPGSKASKGKERKGREQEARASEALRAETMEHALEKHEHRLDRIRAESLSPPAPPPPSSTSTSSSLPGPSTSSDRPLWRSKDTPPHQQLHNHQSNLPPPDFQPGLSLTSTPFTSPTTTINSNSSNLTSVASSSSTPSSSQPPASLSDPVHLLLHLHSRSDFSSILEGQTDGVAWTSIVLDVFKLGRFNGFGKTVEGARLDAAVQALKARDRGRDGWDRSWVWEEEDGRGRSGTSSGRR
ncbi:hypothetical protein BDY24DRAFT_437938, partial [Mrakia frigida]|uniref:uncharacterized protein n=1 Tax=Mrakia frigida TaxID=29902 RepID=UPI003FCC0E6C